VSGLAVLCAGPILGAVLTVAAASGQPARGAALLAVYAAGITAPLFALAAAWDRLRIGQWRWLRGTGIRVGPLHLHTNSVISGVLFAGLGVIFLRYQAPPG
jgi:cytochrome c biogenesis protein CcdA